MDMPPNEFFVLTESHTRAFLLYAGYFSFLSKVLVFFTLAVHVGILNFSNLSSKRKAK